MTVIASRTLRFEDRTLDIEIKMPTWVDADDVWKCEFTLTEGDNVHRGHAFGTDSLAAVLTVFTALRGQLQKDERPWGLFPEEREPWHWIPRTVPVLTKKFDDVVSEAVTRQHTLFCNTYRSDGTRRDGTDE